MTAVISLLVKWRGHLVDSSKNHNKFYELKLLERGSDPHPYEVYAIWGRIGAQGRSQPLYKGSLLSNAKDILESKRRAKEANGYSTVTDSSFTQSTSKTQYTVPPGTVAGILMKGK